eukprot:5645965-Amphidinium_carterae.1
MRARGCTQNLRDDVRVSCFWPSKVALRFRACPISCARYDGVRELPQDGCKNTVPTRNLFAERPTR